MKANEIKSAIDYAIQEKYIPLLIDLTGTHKYDSGIAIEKYHTPEDIETAVFAAICDCESNPTRKPYVIAPDWKFGEFPKIDSYFHKIESLGGWLVHHSPRIKAGDKK